MKFFDCHCDTLLKMYRAKKGFYNNSFDYDFSKFSFCGSGLHFRQSLFIFKLSSVISRGNAHYFYEISVEASQGSEAAFAGDA